MESILPSEKIVPTVCSAAPLVEELEKEFSVELELLRKEMLSPRPQAIRNLMLSLNADSPIS